MDLKHLEVFNEICKQKNFSNAAKELDISQPTVSAHIKTLEENLGLKLFNRKNKTTGNLTEAGQVLHQYSKQILSLVDEAESSLKHYKQGLAGTLSLVTSHTFCNWILPNILEDFKQKYPLVEIVLHTEFTPKMIEMIDSREVHFAMIRTGSPKFADHRLKSLPIGEDPAVFVVSPHHRFVGQTNISIEDILQEPFIAFSRKSSYWPQVENTFTSIGIDPNITMELNDIHAVKKMIEINMGISILPLISVINEIETGKLKMVDVFGFPKIRRYSHLIYQKDLVITGPIGNFLKFIHETKPFSL